MIRSRLILMAMLAAAGMLAGIVQAGAAGKLTVEKLEEVKGMAKAAGTIIRTVPSPPDCDFTPKTITARPMRGELIGTSVDQCPELDVKPAKSIDGNLVTAPQK